jgi:hypothetical protein
MLLNLDGKYILKWRKEVDICMCSVNSQTNKILLLKAINESAIWKPIEKIDSSLQ